MLKRINYIEKFLDAGIDIKIYGNLENHFKILSKQSMRYILNILSSLKLNSLIDNTPLKNYKQYSKYPISNYSSTLRNSSHPPVFGLEMYKLLSKANITFNIHIDESGKCAGNIRMFEATGLGSCLITDHKDNIKSIFDPDNEIITYKNVDECIEKIKWLQEHPLKRAEIAAKGQSRTLREHSTIIRAKYIDEIISKELFNY